MALSDYFDAGEVARNTAEAQAGQARAEQLLGQVVRLTAPTPASAPAPSPAPATAEAPAQPAPEPRTFEEGVAQVRQEIDARWDAAQKIQDPEVREQTLQSIRDLADQTDQAEGERAVRLYRKNPLGGGRL